MKKRQSFCKANGWVTGWKTRGPHWKILNRAVVSLILQDALRSAGEIHPLTRAIVFSAF